MKNTADRHTNLFKPALPAMLSAIATQYSRYHTSSARGHTQQQQQQQESEQC